MELLYDADNTPYIMWGEYKICLENEDISTDKFFLEKARNELRETDDVVQDALEKFRELLRGEPELNVPLDDDKYLIKFLRPCKFYPESALKRMKQYYQFRKSHPNHCKDLLPSKIRKAFEQSVISILAPRDQHGQRIMMVESGERWKPSEVPLNDMFRGIQLALEGAMVEPKTQVAGVVVLFDMKGLSLSQVMHFTPMFAKMVVEWIQDCIPIRLKAVYIINQPYIFNMLFALFKPFLREKLRKRIHFLGSDMNKLREVISPKSLRKRHGGELPEPEVPGEILWKMLSHYEADFQLSNSFGFVDKEK